MRQNIGYYLQVKKWPRPTGAITRVRNRKMLKVKSIIVKFENAHLQANLRLEKSQGKFLADNIDAMIKDCRLFLKVAGGLRGDKLSEALSAAGYGALAGRLNANHDKRSAISYIVDNAASILAGVKNGDYDNVTHLRGIKKKHQELTDAPKAKRKPKSGQGKPKGGKKTVNAAPKWKGTNAENWQAQFAAIEDFAKASGIDFDKVISFWFDEANEKPAKQAAAM